MNSRRSRSPDGRYRTAPLRGLWTHTKGGFYHDGRFPTLAAVINHYDAHFSLGLSAGEKYRLGRVPEVALLMGSDPICKEMGSDPISGLLLGDEVRLVNDSAWMSSTSGAATSGVSRSGACCPSRAGTWSGPFIFFDHIGPTTFAAGIPKSVDVRPHPHIGLATVTYLFAGEIMHRDSVGVQQAIQPNEVNWMIAGRGITHSERFEKARAEGGPMHGIQAWVALPNEHEEIAPVLRPLRRGRAAGSRRRRRTHPPAGRIRVWPEQRSHHAFAAVLRALGARQPARAWRCPYEYSERATYVAAGEVEAHGRKFGPGKMLVFDKGEDSTITAARGSTLMALGGEPVGERFIEWNFVSSSRERIEQAKSDWRAGRMKLPDFDNQEFIPLA